MVILRGGGLVQCGCESLFGIEKVGGEDRREGRIDNEVKKYNGKDVKEVRIVERVCEVAFFSSFRVFLSLFE